MLQNPNQKYQLYTEYLCLKIRIPYFVFAFILSTHIWISVWLLSPSDRNAYLTWLIRDFGFLFTLTVFWISIMMRRLRDLSVTKLINSDTPFPREIREKIENYLYIVFSPHLSRKKELPQILKRHPYLFNHLYLALLFSSIAGITGLILGLFDPYFGYTTDIINDGIGVAVIWFFVIIIGYMMIGITAILRELSAQLKFPGKKQNFSSIVKIKELKAFPLNMLYSYLPFMVVLPSIMSVVNRHSPWKYGMTFILILGVLGFLAILIIPGYYVHLIIKNIKENTKNQIFHSIEELEGQIYGSSSKKSSEEYKLYMLKKYELCLNMIEKIERVKTWPFGFESFVKIMVVGIIGNIPAVIQLFAK